MVMFCGAAMLLATDLLLLRFLIDSCGQSCRIEITRVYFLVLLTVQMPRKVDTDC